MNSSHWLNFETDLISSNFASRLGYEILSNIVPSNKNVS